MRVRPGAAAGGECGSGSRTPPKWLAGAAADQAKNATRVASAGRTPRSRAVPWHCSGRRRPSVGGVLRNTIIYDFNNADRKQWVVMITHPVILAVALAIQKEMEWRHVASHMQHCIMGPT